VILEGRARQRRAWVRKQGEECGIIFVSQLSYQRWKVAGAWKEGEARVRQVYPVMSLGGARLSCEVCGARRFDIAVASIGHGRVDDRVIAYCILRCRQVTSWPGKFRQQEKSTKRSELSFQLRQDSILIDVQSAHRNLRQRAASRADLTDVEAQALRI
jgi:hypothetical protein